MRFMVSTDFDRMKDEARFYYKSGSEFVRIGPEKKLYFRLDHFSGCRIGLFTYASREIGGTAQFSDFVYGYGAENG